MGLRKQNEAPNGESWREEQRRCSTLKGEDVNPVTYNGRLKKKNGMYGAASIKCFMSGYTFCQLKNTINEKLNGNIEEGCNISFSYKSTQEFCSLFNCARGRGFNVGISVSLKYSVKEKNRRKSGYLKREKKEVKRRSRDESCNRLQRRTMHTHTHLHF